MVAKSKSLSIIDSGLNVEGTVHAHGKLVIAGTMEGILVGTNVVTARGAASLPRQKWTTWSSPEILKAILSPAKA